jgi:hypothetical protein
MSLTVTRARVKEKCGVSTTTYDTSIDDLILELVPVLEYQISAQALADSGTGVIATLDLAATEIVCAEFLAERFRELGSTDSVTIGDVRLVPRDGSDELRRRGYDRLRPFLRSDAYMPSRVGIVAVQEVA